MDLFMPLIIKFLKAFGQEAEIALEKLQEKYADKKLSTNGLVKNTTKQETDGDEKGK